MEGRTTEKVRYSCRCFRNAVNLFFYKNPINYELFNINSYCRILKSSWKVSKVHYEKVKSMFEVGVNEGFVIFGHGKKNLDLPAENKGNS